MKHIEVKPLYSEIEHSRTLYRVDYDNGRHYYEVTDGALKFYPSWTTVIKSVIRMNVELAKWYESMGWAAAEKYSAERAHYGTILHIILAEFSMQKELGMHRPAYVATSYAMSEKLDMSLVNGWHDDLRKDAIAFAQFCHDYNMRPIAVEIPLASTNCGVAGTIDLVCEIDVQEKGFWGEVYKSGERKGEPKETKRTKTIRALIDIKSGRKGFHESGKYQLHGYKTMWEENFPDMPIDAVFNWSPKDWTGSEPTYNFTDQTNAREGVALAGLLMMYHALNPDSRPGSTIVCEGVVALGASPSEVWRYVDIETLLKQRHNNNTGDMK